MCNGHGAKWEYDGIGVYRVVSCLCEKCRDEEPVETIFARWKKYEQLHRQN
ncbi:hypothetical protein [Alkalibacillus silvisoli]|uniref:Inhibitor of sigma-G Gin n=1 Tax=Alkalibacillus silvisoli TaxID=392823 RepID=A0ABP3JJV4_9BACI